MGLFIYFTNFIIKNYKYVVEYGVLMWLDFGKTKSVVFVLMLRKSIATWSEFVQDKLVVSYSK